MRYLSGRNLGPVALAGGVFEGEHEVVHGDGQLLPGTVPLHLINKFSLVFPVILAQTAVITCMNRAGKEYMTSDFVCLFCFNYQKIYKASFVSI